MVTSQPDATGHFGPYGGRFVPEVLMAPLEELERAYCEATADPAFQAELDDLLHNYAGRPTPRTYAIREAMRDWVTNVGATYCLLGSALGAHPYPVMVRDFHRVIGIEARAEILVREGRLPDAAFACVGGGSNAIGLFHAFIGDET